MANALDVINSFLGQDAPLLTGNAPQSGMGLYFNPQNGGQPRRQKQSNMGSAIDTIRQQFPGNSVSDTMHGHETGLMNAGPEEQEKKSFWKTPGGSILGTLLTTLGTAGVGAGLGALSGGRRGAGQGAAMGGGMAFLNDLMMRKAAAQMPANEQTQKQKLLELVQKSQMEQLQYQTPEMRNYAAGLKDPGFAEQLKQQQAARGALTPYQQASLGLQQQGLELRRDTAAKGPQGRALPATSANMLAEGMLLPEMVGSLKQSVEEHKGVMGPVKGFLRSLNPYDVEAQSLQGDIDRVKQMVGKFLEGGVLRKEDELKYNKILATLKNTPETAQVKLLGVMNGISQKYNAHLSSLGKAGYDVSQYQPLTITSAEEKKPQGAQQKPSQQTAWTSSDEEELKKLNADILKQTGKK